MLARTIVESLKQSTKILSPTVHRRYKSYLPSEDGEENNMKTRYIRKLEEWRRETFPSNKYLSQKPMSKSTTLKSWYKSTQYEYLQWSQRYIAERNQTLGHQLALTHFILHRGGRVKQKGAADFLCSDDLLDLPTSHTPNWLIEEIDLSKSEICYTGLDNFKNIPTLRKVSFKGCEYFDDWCVEKFMSRCPDVEYLDISDCENVTERGIEGLYRSWNLKNVVATDYGYGVAFELTCLMLEDSIPGLKVEIINAPKSNENVE